jgi:ankyrin repeat protein
LLIAAYGGRLYVVKCLVNEFDAKVNQRCQEGATPLIIAAEKGHLNVLRFLANEARADVNQGTNDGATPLYFATLHINLDVIRCLIAECGASVNQANSIGVTPLYIAAQYLHLDIVRCLTTEFGADVNLANEDGITALMAAAVHNNQDLIKHLVHKGANVRAVSRNGNTATMFLQKVKATAAQIAYLKVREYCANPGCDGGGRKRCVVCKETRYCGKPCQIAHWRVHPQGCQLPIDRDTE